MSASRQKQASSREGLMSALPSTAVIHQGDGYVSFVPTGDIARALLWTIFWVKTWRSRASVKVNTTFFVGERYGRLATPCFAHVADEQLYEQLRIRFYIHQNFPGDDFGVSKIKVMQACLNKLQHFIVRRIGAFAVLEYHHSDTDAFAPIQYIIRSESVRFP